MNRKKKLLQMISLAWTMLMLVSCAAPPVTPMATPVPPTPTVTAELPPPTPEPQVWDYVALGGTIVLLPGDFSYTAHYAAYLEEDLGVKVNSYILGAGRNKLSSQLLDKLRNDQSVRDQIGEAEVVTIVIGNYDVYYQLSNDYRNGECGGEENMECIRETLASFSENYDAILTEIATLSSPGTIIRTMTHYYGDLTEAEPIFYFDEDLHPFIEPLNEEILRIAAAHNVPVARVDLTFNGLTGEEDPVAKGYLTEDTLHTTQLGAAKIAEVHRELGYEPTVP